MNRRVWVAASLGVSSLAAFEVLDTESARDLEELTAEIIPAAATPGAREARTVQFIDRALATFDRDKRAEYREGLAAWRARAAEMFPGSAGLASLTSGQRIALLKAVENSPFFQLVRTHAIMAFLADPVYGGNPEGGYQTLGVRPAHRWAPPFGWYDDRANGGEN